MEEDEEVAYYLSPGKDSIAGLTPSELSTWLAKRGFSLNHCSILEENKVDGNMFCKLTRSDLKDLFPVDFLTRKKFSDLLSNLQQEPNLKSAPSPSHSFRSSTPLSNVSTLSTSSISLEEDPPLSQSQPSPSVPALKRTKPREFPEPTVKRVKLLGQDFKLPITAKIRECVKQNTALDEATRKQLIRETVTCVATYVGERLTSKHFEDAAKQLCHAVPLLKDAKPPLWPEEVEFDYWASTKHLLKKRYSNVKGGSKKLKGPNISDSFEVDQSEEDVAKHNKQLLKELRNRMVNWKAVEQLQRLTFDARREKISTFKGMHAVNDMLEQFPYLEHEKVLLWELELLISKLTKKKCEHEVFITRWKRLTKCFVDESNMDDLAALQKIHEPFTKMAPLLLTLKGGEKMENFLEDIPSKSPYLVHVEGDTADSATQMFVILEQDVLCECIKHPDYSLPLSSLVTLVAVYYTFNLEYEDERKHLFKFLEEHIFGMMPKRKTYLLKQLENKLLSKLNSPNSN